MARIVGVHGINQQLLGARKLLSAWRDSLESGVENAGRTIPGDSLACAFYGDLFRAPGHLRGGADGDDGSEDDQTFDQQLLMALWHEAASDEPRRVVPPSAEIRGRTPLAVQSALNALSQSKFFTGIADHLMLGGLRQVRRYLKEPTIRLAAQAAVDRVVTTETRVLVGHSLGSVVSYEALHRYASSPNWANVRTFITLGSPLGIQNLIFDRLDPAPQQGRGAWPSLIERWVNISDDHDIVALQKNLKRFFPGNLNDIAIDNEATAHDVSPYLTSRAAGEAIADGLV